MATTTAPAAATAPEIAYAPPALDPRAVCCDPLHDDVWRHGGAWWAPLAWRPHLGAMFLAAAMVVLAIVVAAAAGLPLRDADGVLGKRMWVLIWSILAFLVLDIVPRAFLARRRGESRSFPGAVRAVLQDRWSRRRLGVVLAGLLSFYATYIAYRNLKSFLPFVVEQNGDAPLLDFERSLFGGTDPATLLHGLLGTGAAAHLLSSVYLFYLAFIPISLGAALILASNPVPGMWWVTALGLNWILGTASYYLVPSLGPVFADPGLFVTLPETGVSALQSALVTHRAEVLADPFATGEVQSIAAFASLHVSVVFSAAMIAQLLGLHWVLRRALWLFLVVTLAATIYFGWHYLLDDVAGLVIGAIAVVGSAAMTGHWRVLSGRHG
jgi:hypothetical protein